MTIDKSISMKKYYRKLKRSVLSENMIMRMEDLAFVNRAQNLNTFLLFCTVIKADITKNRQSVF